MGIFSTMKHQCTLERRMRGTVVCEEAGKIDRVMVGSVKEFDPYPKSSRKPYSMLS